MIDSWFPFVGGAQIHLQEVSQILKKQELIEFEILSPQKVFLPYRLFWTFWVVLQAVALNSEFEYDLIHSHGFHSGVSAKLISLIMGKPVIHTAHGSSQLDQQKKNFKAYLERLALVQISYDRLITVTRSFLKHQPKTKVVEVIPNGVNIQVFDQIKAEKHKQLSAKDIFEL